MEQNRRRVAVYVTLAILSVAAVGYFIYATGDQPLWKRLSPWILVYEFLMRGGPLTTFEKFEMMSLVSLMAMIVVFLRRRWRLTYHVTQLIFGVLAAWYSMSFDMTASPALNTFILLGSAWVVGEGVEGIYVDVGIFEKVD
jgi:hypothetical protein